MAYIKLSQSYGTSFILLRYFPPILSPSTPLADGSRLLQPSVLKSGPPTSTSGEI